MTFGRNATSACAASTISLNKVMMLIFGPLIVLAILAAIVGSMMFLSQRDQLSVQRAQALIANPPKMPDRGEIVFRKPKAAGYMLILLFIFILCLATYSVVHSPGLLHIEGIRAGIVVLIGLYPLAMGIRSLRYEVRVSNDELTMSDLTTRSVPLRDISDVNMGTSRITSFCQINLMSGEESLTVASDLKHFPEFVSLLCNRVAR
jgi:hypothetical protein